MSSVVLDAMKYSVSNGGKRIRPVLAVEFAKLCKRNGIDCRFSIVDCIGETEVEACKRLAQSVNIPLYVRSYITDS